MSSILFLFWLIGITFSLAGVQFCYSIQFAIGSPLFTDSLKLQNSIVPVILSTVGPFSGFIIQPIIGAFSDKCNSKYGRRRPFILVGTIFCAIGMAIIGNSVILGNIIGDKSNGSSPSDHKFGLFFAIIGLLIMNIFVNVMQGPARAIVADIVPDEKQQTGNAMVSNVMGFAAITANLVGAQFFNTSEPYRYLFLIGVIFLLLSAIPTMIVAKEVPYQEDIEIHNNINDDNKQKKSGFIEVFIDIWKACRYMPISMLKITLLFFFSWASFSPFMIYITTWFGQNVFGGNQSSSDQHLHQLYQDGVKMGMYGLAIFAGVQWIYSLILPYFIKIFGVKFSYFFSQFLVSGAYIAFIWLNHIGTGFLLMGIVALNFTTFNSIPFALVSDIVKNKAGLYMGVLNSASVIAQTVTNLIAGSIVGWKNQNVSYGIAFGGLLSLIACLFIFLIDTKNEKDEKEDETSPLLKENEN